MADPNTNDQAERCADCGEPLDTCAAEGCFADSLKACENCGRVGPTEQVTVGGDHVDLCAGGCAK